MSQPKTSFVVVDRISGRHFHPGPFFKGDRLVARLEPENKQDSKAVCLKNRTTGRLVGYIPAELAHILADHISVETLGVLVVSALKDLIAIKVEGDEDVMNKLQINIEKRTDVLPIRFPFPTEQIK